MGTTRLYTAASIEEQWRDVSGPWLRARGGDALKTNRPTVVLTPSRAESFYLRSRMVAEGVPYLGLRFWTPSDARKYLLTALSPGVAPATQAELRLVARACAEKLADAEPDDATSRSVVREPGAFLRAYDLLLGAGWDPATDGAEYGRDLAQVMTAALKQCGIATQAGLHRELRRLISITWSKEPTLPSLLVVGFNATHWPLWDLLQVAVLCAGDVTVALTEPRVFGEEVDQLWISSWEEITREEAVVVPGDGVETEVAAPFSGLVASYEQGTRGDSSAVELGFLVTPDLASQIRAIVLQTLTYLKQESCTRLGLVFAEANALALGVAQELRRLGLPLDDGTGAFQPGLFETRAWRAWMALQEEPGVARLIAWVRACEAQGLSTGMAETLRARDVANVLETALGETLVDDLGYLARYLERATGDRSGRVANFLRQRIALPESTTFSHFLELARQAFALTGWEKYLSRLQIDPPDWLHHSEEVISRPTFLAWLSESTASQVRTRGADGNHFYGRIHLTIYAQMTGQTWSHLILSGLNEGVWPRMQEAGAFGSRHELAALNRQARALNAGGVAQGGQGVGHDVVAAGRGHCLLPLEKQDLALRDLCAALESTRVAACLTAVTTEGGRSLLPNDFFSHAYQAKTGRALDEETFRRLAHATDAWRRNSSLPDDATPDPIVEDLPLFSRPRQYSTRTAYDARRDPAQPFGRYEFAYADAPVRPVQLSCKRWEDAWNHPASVWLEDVVGASAWPEGTLSWQRAVGTWVHRWLAAALREWQESPDSPRDLPALIAAAAQRSEHGADRLARETGVELYPWWNQVWAQARSVALGLGETLAPVLPGRPFLCEFKLPPDLLIALPGTERVDFLLRGRVDLLLLDPGAATPDPVEPVLDRRTCWVVDFKTGSADKLTMSKISRGGGLQAVLYALAARARGAASVAISLHTGEELKDQVQLDAVLATTPLFRSLDVLHRLGIFGMRPGAESDYGFSRDYPMATRFVPSGILEAKWALMHRSEPEPETEAE